MNQTVDPVKRYKAKMKAIADEKRCDKMIADYGVNTYQQFKNGRDYRSFKHSFITKQDRENYRTNFDKIFPNSPGADM